MSSHKDYFDYLENVLGINTILLDPQPDEVTEKVPLLIAVQNLTTYSDPEKDLLGKMVGALKIDIEKIKVVDLLQATRFHAEFTIHFVDDVAAGPAPQENAITTHSPRHLTHHPELKKQAWTEMQKVVQHFHP